jgi:hypothetical protein
VRELSIKALHELLPTPSQGSTSEGVRHFIDYTKPFTLHGGRPNANFGPPVALFHPVLGLLAHHISHLDEDIPEATPSPIQFARTHELIIKSLGAYPSKQDRIEDIRDTLAKALGLENKIRWNQSVAGIVPDGCYGDQCAALFEIKNENGTGGDGSLQVAFDYATIYTDSKV